MPMGMPVCRGHFDDLGKLLPGRIATPCEGQRAYDLPSRVKRVQLGCIRRLEDKLPLGMRQREQQDITL
jgi:hypothetical protein